MRVSGLWNHDHTTDISTKRENMRRYTSKEPADVAPLENATATQNGDSKVDLAEARLAWLNSLERKRFVRNGWLIGAALPVIVAGGALICKLIVVQPEGVNYLTYMAAGALFWIFPCAYVGFPVSYISARRAFKDRRLLERERAELLQAESEVVSGATDFKSLWTVTQKRLDYYHKIATTQAEQSFQYGQIAAGAGFFIILISVIVAALAHSTAASISAVVSGISGGGLGAFIGATFMKSQDTASTQLREYFHQPLDFSKYLAAERLLEQLGESERPAAIQKIIESMVGTPSSTGDSA